MIFCYQGAWWGHRAWTHDHVRFETETFALHDILSPFRDQSVRGGLRGRARPSFLRFTISFECFREIFRIISEGFIHLGELTDLFEGVWHFVLTLSVLVFSTFSWNSPSLSRSGRRRRSTCSLFSLVSVVRLVSNILFAIFSNSVRILFERLRFPAFAFRPYPWGLIFSCSSFTLRFYISIAGFLSSLFSSWSSAIRLSRSEMRLL